MKHITFNYFKIASLLGLVLVMASCERELSDEATFATFPSNGDIFTDNPVGLTDAFFISFDPNGGANTNGFGTDEIEVFEGNSSIRIDVPSATDPDGGFIGGIFKDRGNGRNLTQYDALTFYAKASTTATIGLFGFGTDFEEDKYAVALTNTELSTTWKKYTIPIPDASKLIQEKGMFIFSAGSGSTGGSGYTFWLDEIRFETLGTLAQAQPAIFNGVDIQQQGFVNVPIDITGLTQTFNAASGNNITVSAAPAYFDFESSNNDIAFVNEQGVVSVIEVGEATIMATLDNVSASGSLTLDVQGSFDFAPTPTRDPSTVISIFSDTYTNIPVSRYNSFFEPFQDTLGGVVNVGTQTILSYTDLNFVGIVFNDVIFPAEAVPPVDATNATHLHIDINVQEALQNGDQLLLELTNFGATETTGGYTISGNDLQTNNWASFDIPLSAFSGLTDRSAIGLLLFNSQIGPDPTISEIIFDNIYFYTE